MIMSDEQAWLNLSSGLMEFSFVSGVLPPAEFAAADLVVFIGPMTNLQRGVELAGAMKLALERRATFVFLYNTLFLEHDRRFIYQLLPYFSDRPITGQSVQAAASEPAPHPAFRAYITQHGQTDLQFYSLPDGAEVLASAVVTSQPYQASPTAVRIEFAGGSVYVLPYQPPTSPQMMLERLVEAVLEHQEGRLVAVPPFFEELRVPDEDKVIQGIVDARDELERLERQRVELTRHKHLVGHLSGEQLEDLVIEEMNLILSGTEVQARDVEERHVEDFELVDTAGTRKALAESKAAGGGVTLGHVNQVNSHRSELFDATVDELPGLLVVNTFRNDDALDRRRESVHERIVRHARRMNVLVLRSWDVYQLVVRRLEGRNDGAEVLAALLGGGGWLEVEETSLRTHTE
jgi:hypothetical protein